MAASAVLQLATGQEPIAGGAPLAIGIFTGGRGLGWCALGVSLAAGGLQAQAGDRAGSHAALRCRWPSCSLARLVGTRARPSAALCRAIEKAIVWTCRHLPRSWQERLFPVFDEDAEGGPSGEEACSDLLSASQRRLWHKEQNRRDVVLGIETFTALQSKVRAWGPLLLTRCVDGPERPADPSECSQYITLLTWVRDRRLCALRGRGRRPADACLRARRCLSSWAMAC